MQETVIHGSGDPPNMGAKQSAMNSTASTDKITDKQHLLLCRTSTNEESNEGSPPRPQEVSKSPPNGFRKVMNSTHNDSSPLRNKPPSEESKSSSNELPKPDISKDANNNPSKSAVTSKRPPRDFRLANSAEESHKKKIYCITWSTDIHIDDGMRGGTRSDQSGNKRKDDSDETITESSVDPTESSVAFTESSMDDELDQPRKRSLRCLATCGGNHVSIYETEIPSDVRGRKKSSLELRQVYVDPSKDEEFYVCAFGGRSPGSPFGFEPITDHDITPIPLELGHISGQKRPREEAPPTRSDVFKAMVDLNSFDGPQLLCVAGSGTVIKVIDTVRRMLLITLSGHGNDIYDLKFSPTDEWLLASASTDESIRLWNVKNATCVAIFAGHEGHRDAVLSVAWHPYGDCFVSGGMDTTVKLWDIGNGTEAHKSIKASKKVRPRLWDSSPSTTKGDYFRTVYEQMPYFSTRKVHVDYVDCVQFVGDLILSKSIDNDIILWKPVLTRSRVEDKSTQQRLPSEVVALREFRLSDADVWFIRFHTNPDCTILACGNNIGEIKVWDIDANPKKENVVKLTNQYCTSSIRMVSLSPDSKCLVAACDDASIWQWDAI